MSRKMPEIHPIRFVALLFLALVVAYASYTYVKPQTFTYAKIRDDQTAEAGTPLTVEQLEPTELVIGGLLPLQGAPVAGLIAWDEVEALVGLPYARRVRGGMPLLTSDVELNSEEGLKRQLARDTTGMSIPVDNIIGVTAELTVGERIHLFASFEDESGAHTGLLLREMPVIALQREMDGEIPNLVAVTIALTQDEAVYLTHALHYGKVRLGKASALDKQGAGIGDRSFAASLIRTKTRWDELGEFK